MNKYKNIYEIKYQYTYVVDDDASIVEAYDKDEALLFDLLRDGAGEFVISFMVENEGKLEGRSVKLEQFRAFLENAVTFYHKKVDCS